MPEARFRKTDDNSFFGSLVYDRIIPQSHSLRLLKDLLDWDVITEQLIDYYKGGGEYGAVPYEPSLVVRMLFTAYLFNLSERQVEEFVNYHLPAKFFVGLAVDHPAPDHSTLSVFKGRLIAKDEGKAFGVLFDYIIGEAKSKDIKFGDVQVVDSVHTIADVNTHKDKGRQSKGDGPRDKDARWGAKGKRVKVKDEATGKDVTKRTVEYFFGYKSHVSMNAENSMATSATFTSGEAYDGHQLEGLVEQDEAKGIDPAIYTGDQGYDDGENHLYLESKGKKSAIKLGDYRTEKKDGNKEKWIAMKADEDYRKGIRQRGRVEAKFGEGKTQHGLRRCRYLGLVRYKVQGYFTLMVMNLKRMVKLIHGVGFRTLGEMGIARPA